MSQKTSIKDLRGKIKRPIRVAKVCTDGDLWARYDEINEQLVALDQKNSGEAKKLGGNPEVTRLQAELAEVEQKMREAEVEVAFRGAPQAVLADLKRRFPANNGVGWDIDAGSAALIAACAVDPTTEDEAKELLDELSFGAADKLVDAAWTATIGRAEVPTSARVSAQTQG